MLTTDEALDRDTLIDVTQRTLRCLSFFKSPESRHQFVKDLQKAMWVVVDSFDRCSAGCLEQITFIVYPPPGGCLFKIRSTIYFSTGFKIMSTICRQLLKVFASRKGMPGRPIGRNRCSHLCIAAAFAGRMARSQLVVCK